MSDGPEISDELELHLARRANQARSKHAKTRARAPNGTFLPEGQLKKRERLPGNSIVGFIANRVGKSERFVYQLFALGRDHRALYEMARRQELSIRAAYDISRDAGIEYLFLGKVMPLKTALDIVRNRQVQDFVQIMELDGIPLTQRAVAHGEIELDEVLELIRHGELIEFEAMLRNIAQSKRTHEHE